METGGGGGGGGGQPAEAVVRKGPWTMEEDLVLVNYIAANGEGAWNNLARAAGLNRNGKSCRLRWLNYLRPDVRRGDITPEEHTLIVNMQGRWGNKWSKIARHLPGRTDNEIKNFWRTKVQKKHKNKECSAGESAMAAAGYHHYHSIPAIIEDQGSSNSGRTGVTQDYGMAQHQPSISSLEHHDYQFQSCGGGGAGRGGGGSSGGGGMDDVPPEFLGASGENFWGIEDFWPSVHSFHGSS
ncbi:hypothetical protein ACP70R_039366 [Stipagrostis hirtigluma subsp. patula]